MTLRHKEEIDLQAGAPPATTLKARHREDARTGAWRLHRAGGTDKKPGLDPYNAQAVFQTANDERNRAEGVLSLSFKPHGSGSRKTSVCDAGGIPEWTTAFMSYVGNLGGKMARRYLTLNEVAKALGFSPEIIRGAIDDGDLIVLKGREHGRKLIPLEEVRPYLVRMGWTSAHIERALGACELTLRALEDKEAGITS